MGNPSPGRTAGFNQKAVGPRRKSGTTRAEAARGPGCDAGSLSDWARKTDTAGRRPTPTRSGRPRACAGRGERTRHFQKRAPSSPAGSCRPFREEGGVKFVSPNEPDWPASGMRAALKAARQGYYAWKSRPRAPAPCATPNWPS